MKGDERLGLALSSKGVGPRDYYRSGTEFGEASREVATASAPLWIASARIPLASGLAYSLTPESSQPARSSRETQEDVGSMTLREFVQRKFLPEYVDIRRTAGRAHFRAILKHVLPPEQITTEPTRHPEKVQPKLKSIAGWPYLDTFRLREIDPAKIRILTRTALDSGYSVQTVTHIRNVLRAIFSYAIASCSYDGANPALHVFLPSVARKEPHTLTLDRLQRVMEVMRYPEKAVALLALLTDMNVTEICGLQWSFVNISNNSIRVEDDWIPPRRISVRCQWYRGEFGPVKESRKRLVPVPDLLCSVLREIRNRRQFTKAEDFVVASRIGTPVYPENLAARRLKSVGRSLGIHWLSWSAFRRSHIQLKSQFGRHIYQEYEKALSLQIW